LVLEEMMEIYPFVIDPDGYAVLTIDPARD
jgi:hypothetical protein